MADDNQLIAKGKHVREALANNASPFQDDGNGGLAVVGAQVSGNRIETQRLPIGMIPRSCRP